MAHKIIGVALVLSMFVPIQDQGAKREKLQELLGDNVADFWIYDDLEAAEKLAKKNGKPLLISFRCVP